MKCRLLSLFLSLSLCLVPALAGAAETLTLYTSLPEALSGVVVKAFVSRYPEIRVDRQSAPSDKLAERLADECRRGSCPADVLWTEDLILCYQLKAAKMFLPYISSESRGIWNILPDFDGSFTPVRYAVFGFASALDAAAKPPRQWRDLVQPSDVPFGVLSPTASSLAYISSALLGMAFKWRLLGTHSKARMFQDRTRLLDEAASGSLSACFVEDLAVAERAGEAQALRMSYPQELVVVPSSAGIFRTTKQWTFARKFIDFLLSPEGQRVIAESGTLPALPGIAVPDRFGMPSVEEVRKRAVKGDFAGIVNSREFLINKFVAMILRHK